MEAEETMELRDLPVDTRNYTIIDNITGKPIDQSNYSLTIDPEVISKLNTLKKVNEEKIRQATLRGLYQDSTLVDTFTPEDNSVFTPVYEDEYISNHDYNISEEESSNTPVAEEETTEPEEEKPTFAPTEVLQQDTILERVVARDPKEKQAEEEARLADENAENGENTENIDGENTENAENQAVDNSTFTPQMAGLKEASEQIVQIDTEKLGPAIKPPKHQRPSTKINLDVMEIREAKGYAWLAYLLFFLPLLINRRNRFVRIHANEGLELNLMEILGGLLLLPYYLLPTLEGTWHTVTFILALCGIVLLGMCALTIIPMMICAMCGLQFQTPWLWKKRIIKVKETRE